jgi:hypothetical protein
MPRSLEAWTPAAYLASIVATGLLALVGWLVNQQIKDIEFRSHGGRFTHIDEATSMQQQRDWIDRRFTEFTEARDRLVDILVHSVHQDLKREDRRLQCQIDRIEGRECILDGLNLESPLTRPEELMARVAEGASPPEEGLTPVTK